MTIASLTAVNAIPSSVLIEDVKPQIDAGRYPVKREVGDTLEVSADIFKDGHDALAAVVRYRRWDEDEWREAEMTFVDNDRWAGSFPLTENTRYVYTVQAFPDAFATWLDEIGKKIAADVEIHLEIQEGIGLILETAGRVGGGDQDQLEAAVAEARAAADPSAAAKILMSGGIDALMARHRSRAHGKTFERELTVVVDRVRARYASWYSMFPRSAGSVEGQSATFRDVIDQLPRLESMGFDVLYFTPIHPIGSTNKKGRNNTLGGGPDDPGVPYAIGSAAGGHDAVDPQLGTLDDFDELVRQAAARDMEIALDIAIQASPDHPWIREHPEWFFIRPDGSIRYAENPPKKYQDVHPVNFESSSWRELWEEQLRIIRFWVGHGVKTFRVDNPHTKPTVFWEWLINEVQRTNPEVIFLSEAFTRPKVMKALAKAGYTQSYTYFTWRNTKVELTEYLTELTQDGPKEYMRGNLFTNTHDINPYILQQGGRAAFQSRFLLAATLSSVYGIYSGFELCENTPVPGREEYLHSEKYEYKVWDWDRPGNIVPLISRVNRIRAEHPALQEYDNLRFFQADNPQILAYGKSNSDYSDNIVVAVNLDPFNVHDSWVYLPIDQFGIADDKPYQAIELISGETYEWRGARQYVRLDPDQVPGQIFLIRPHGT
jgi:starch synthase (maltosyl-transferring)